MPISRKKSVSAMAWPPNMIREDETEQEKKIRLGDEAEAKRVSDLIDHQLESERLQKNKNLGGKILLLGAHSPISLVLIVLQISPQVRRSPENPLYSRTFSSTLPPRHSSSRCVSNSRSKALSQRKIVRQRSGDLLFI